MPTLLLHGRKDRISPYRFAAEMHAAIPQSRLLSLPGGHLTLFMHPQPWLKGVLSFLDHL